LFLKTNAKFAISTIELVKAMHSLLRICINIAGQAKEEYRYRPNQNTGWVTGQCWQNTKSVTIACLLFNATHTTGPGSKSADAESNTALSRSFQYKHPQCRCQWLI